MPALPTTLAAVRSAGYLPCPIKTELRRNLVAALRAGQQGEDLFPGLIGYGETVIPQVVNAVLAGHDLLLLGLRGQAKTRLARALVEFLDEATPALADDPLRSHPLAPVGAVAEDIVARLGDAAPVVWLGREQRYGEKLATPDVSVADLIGDIDPIRASREGFDLGDLRAVTFGIVPRTNRGIFCINELPDLAPRIQVALFNILEEQDVQVRGIPLRLPLDLMLIFTANPEDYTARGQIITPLKDRIGAQILTHYPKERADGIAVMRQEAQLVGESDCVPAIPALLHNLIEETARAARSSEYVDQSSGVSARMTIAALEALHANVLRRGLALGETAPQARMVDCAACLAAMTGKIELAYEGEQEGPLKVGWHVLSEGVKRVWADHFPPVITEDEDERQGPFHGILRWFAAGNICELDDVRSSAEHLAALMAVPELESLAKRHATRDDLALWMEFILEGLFAGGILARSQTDRGMVYRDLLAHMMKKEST